MADRYLSDACLAGIAQRARDGREPWAAAHGQLIAQADAALELERICIRDNGGSPWFRQDAVYVPGKDGERNDEANMRSGQLAARVSAATVQLALAWRLTGEARYATKALQMIHTWCIDQATRMLPAGHVVDARTPGAQYGGDIILFKMLYGLFQACYLLNDCDQWELGAHAGVRRWVRAMVDPQRPTMFHDGTEMYNNWDDARLLYLASGALALDDLDLLGEVFERWRHIIALKMTIEGELPRETMRTRSMTYTLAALNEMTAVAEIARQFGVDLYNLNINGRCLKKAIDYAGHHLLHPDEWRFELLKPLDEEFANGAPLAAFEMAYGQWGDERYLDVIERYGGRPVAQMHATLLCGRG